MRCLRHKEDSNWVGSGLILAIALAFPVLSFGQQSWHAIQFDAGTGFALNPMQSTLPVSSFSSVASLKGWGRESLGRNALLWKGAVDREVYSGQPAADQFRLNMSMNVRRALSENVESGIEVIAFNGTNWEQSATSPLFSREI